ncbi:MAG TPA: class I SAM-dependent methyltransferase [Flavisolibacter sp.]|nr:class I SAM-dependent methyltransferase [Flavisolibacter sp.]
MAKDLFSTQADLYARYRPTYPQELFDHILSFVENRDCAWDCATGNGQAAQVLANHFKKVEATDISEKQLQNAVQKANIHYQLSPAEKTPFADNCFDLITIATAYHWFDWKAFFTEANRVGKHGCVVAAWAYHVFYSVDDNITNIIQHFYRNIVNAYWDKERSYVDDRYTTVEFAFDPLPVKEFDLVLHWSRDDFFGYLSTWSAVQKYIQQNGHSPLTLIEADVKKAWPDDSSKEFHFPLFLKLGRVIK